MCCGFLVCVSCLCFCLPFLSACCVLSVCLFVDMFPTLLFLLLYCVRCLCVCLFLLSAIHICIMCCLFIVISLCVWLAFVLRVA